MKLADFKALVAQARADALKISKAEWDFPYKPSRGTFLATVGKDGPCAPYIEQECHNWNGTKKELDDAVLKVLQSYPEVTEVYVAGGYDGADSPQAFKDGDYQPWVAEWSVTYWKKEGA